MDGPRADARHRPSPLRPHVPRPTRRDGLAGLAVALVLLPQAIAYAVLAGMPPEAGLAVGAVATVAAAPFVSSPYLQTGPTAITALLVFGALAPIAAPASPGYVALAALLALLVGAVRLLIGATRSGVVAYLMSQPVLTGFTPAAALVIVVGQLPALLGVTAAGRGPSAIVPALADVAAWEPGTIAVAALTAAVLLLGRRVHPLFPGVLVAAVVAIVAAALTGAGGATIGAVPTGLPVPGLGLPWREAPDLLVGAVVIALVGFAEASAISRTYARATRTRWDADREFVSQGVANLAAGVVGGFPVGGSFARTALAREAGASTAWTGAFTGLLVLAAAPFLGVVQRLPRAALAAIIVVAVAKLVRLDELWELRRYSRQQFAIAVTTFVLTLVLAPAIQYAVLVGVVLSIAAHLRRELSVAVPSWVEGELLHVRPLGVLFFGSAHGLAQQLDDLLAEHDGATGVVFHMDRLGRVDVTGAMALQQVLDDLHANGLATQVVDLTPTGRRIVDRVLRDERYAVDLDEPVDTVEMPGQLGGPRRR